jgi:hypothetical protein
LRITTGRYLRRMFTFESSRMFTFESRLVGLGGSASGCDWTGRNPGAFD